MPWLVLYEHALLVDDIVDGKSPNWRERFFASQLLYDDFLDTWKDCFVTHPELWLAFRRYHEQAMFSVLREAKEDSAIHAETESLSAGSPGHHMAMGRKAALVKFCGAALLVENKGQVLRGIEESGIASSAQESSCSMIFCDCVEDHGEGRFTYPVRQALLQVEHQSGLLLRSDLNRSDIGIFDVVVSSGVVGQVARLSREYLSAGVSDLGITAGSDTGQFLGSLIGRCAETDLETQCLYANSGAEINDLFNAAVEGHASELVAIPPYDAVWRHLLRQFTRIATAANWAPGIPDRT